MRARICAITGLALLETPITMYRVAVNRVDRGPMNPWLRPDDPAVDRSEWNRFDTPGLTIYGADTRETAFIESLAYKAPSAKDYASLREEARYWGVSLSEILKELRDAGIPVDGVDTDWRMERAIYTLVFPSKAWVDLAHPDTVAAIRASGVAAADRVDLSTLTGDDRATTTRIAQWIRVQTLDTGVTPSGLRYPSKLGFGEDNFCWAVFLAEPNKGCSYTRDNFAANDSDLLRAVELTGVSVP